MHNPSAPPSPTNPYSAPRASILAAEPRLLGASPLSALASPQRRLYGALLYYGASLLAALPLAPILLMADQQNDSLDMVAASGVMLSGLLGLCFSGANIWLATTRGQTIGKWLVGTQVVTQDGRTASAARLLGRYLVKTGLFGIMSCLAFGEDLLIFAKDRRAVHDHIAGTWVVDLAPMKQLRAMGAASLCEADGPPKPNLGGSLNALTAGPVRRFASGILGWTAVFSTVALAAVPALVTPDLDSQLRATMGATLVMGAGVAWLLTNIHLVSTHGTTVSRLFLDLVVVDEHGVPVTWQIYLVRAVMEYGTFVFLSAFLISPVVFLGYLPIFSHGRSLTDLATRTWVLRRGDVPHLDGPADTANGAEPEAAR
ncbi:MAG: RDD family protein [Oligoflexia bacterium]|nr:RDD family protein [Oligoflexia bacterium]